VAINLINVKPDLELPKPLGSWVLVRKEKRSLASGLALPDSVDDSYKFFVADVGPEVEGLSVGDRLELMPRRAHATGVMLNNDYALLPAETIVGTYPAAK
jgi:hypothetical protein